MYRSKAFAHDNIIKTHRHYMLYSLLEDMKETKRCDSKVSEYIYQYRLPEIALKLPALKGAYWSQAFSENV